MLTTLTNIGIEDHHKITSLSKFKNRVINALYLTCIALLFIVAAIRFYSEETSLLIVDVVTLVSVLLSFYLCYEKKHQLALFLLINCFLVLAFVTKKLGNPSEIYFCMIPCLALFLMEDKWLKAYVLVSCYIAILFLRWGNFIFLIPFLSITIGFHICCYFFTRSLENIHRDLAMAKKENEEYLVKLNKKNEDLVMYSNIMVHDLKAPIRTINGFAQILDKETKTNDHRKFIEFILNSSNSMAQLVDNFMVYSKTKDQEYEWETIDLNQLLNEQRNNFKYDLNYKQYKITLKNALPVIHGDILSLRTVFHNLVSNAFKYQPKIEGHIPEVSFTTEENPNDHVIYIQDNGIGIEDKFIKHVFEPFKRNHSQKQFKGTGLGLSICRCILEKHQGTLTIDSTNKHGTTFKLSIPKSRQAEY